MTTRQTNAAAPKLAWDTLLDLGDASAGPLHGRLGRALREAVRSGRLPAGVALPPSRTLADDLGCSRWVVTEAYEQLVAEGYLEARVGSGTRVRSLEGRPDAGVAPPAARPVGPGIDLAPGHPDLRSFPLGRWVAAIRSVAAALPYTDLAYPDPAGAPRLREALAAYLSRVRGASAAPFDVTVTTGTTDGVSRAARALARAGVRAIGVEDPGWPRLWRAAEGAGLDVVPIPVDEHGLDVARLDDAPGVRAVIASPAHQFPSGTVLPPERRTALLEWARRVDGLVLEDDYDAEFRYDRRPVGTLQGTDPAHVALLGSLSKTLVPALGMGWIVTPPAWTERLRAIESGAPSPPVLDQLAFAAFLAAGAYDRHLRASRKRYRARRDLVVRTVERLLPAARVSGVAAGLHLLAHFDPPFDGPAVVTRAAELGVQVAAIEQYVARNRAFGPGLVLGYGNLDDREVEAGIATLARAIREAADGPLVTLDSNRAAPAGG